MSCTRCTGMQEGLEEDKEYRTGGGHCPRPWHETCCRQFLRVHATALLSCDHISKPDWGPMAGNGARRYRHCDSRLVLRPNGQQPAPPMGSGPGWFRGAGLFHGRRRTKTCPKIATPYPSDSPTAKRAKVGSATRAAFAPQTSPSREIVMFATVHPKFNVVAEAEDAMLQKWAFLRNAGVSPAEGPRDAMLQKRRCFSTTQVPPCKRTHH